MKIVAVLESPHSVGGGFQQAVNAILQMHQLTAGRFDFEVLTTRPEHLQTFAGLGIDASQFAYSLIDLILATLTASNVWWQSLQSRLRLVGPFEKRLIRMGCDLVYFVSPTEKSGSLQRLNYLATVWDACHRDMPEFPEVRSFGKIHGRERFFRNHLLSAVATLTDSGELADSIARRYGVDRDRLLPMPFSPAPFADRRDHDDDARILEEHSLVPGYFFYPAQFWAHKNHARIIEALVLLRNEGTSLEVVFAGGDHGSRGHIEKLVRGHGMERQVRFLGFVPDQHMPGLYRSCRAVVMPTYFGPTNLPPLEAWSYGVPLVYSQQFAGQVGDAALLVDPDDVADLASAMRACLDANRCAQLVARGRSRLEQIRCEREAAEHDLLERLQRFEMRLRCWRQ